MMGNHEHGRAVGSVQVRVAELPADAVDAWSVTSELSAGLAWTLRGACDVSIGVKKVLDDAGRFWITVWSWVAGVGGSRPPVDYAKLGSIAPKRGQTPAPLRLKSWFAHLVGGSPLFWAPFLVRPMNS